MKKTVLVTGGAGYIGSHACVELLQVGYQVVVVDNLMNSKAESLRRVAEITGKAAQFYQIDICDGQAIGRVFAGHPIDAVMHFAGLKAVGESCGQPLTYYQNNVGGTLALAAVMKQFDVTKLVFSSSATVYGDPNTVPINEDFPLSATNPYGRTKLMIEDMLRDFSAVDRIKPTVNPWKIALLRYYNPIGAHPSGLIGEDPNGIPTNLMPNITQVAFGKLEQLPIFGNDYPTRDGTAVRDYIHVVDLAQGHVKALEALDNESFKEGGCKAYNLGAGNGHSVLELLEAFTRVTGMPVKHKVVPRRDGDIAECYADPSAALKALRWKARKSLDDMVTDAWRWKTQNPDGYL